MSWLVQIEYYEIPETRDQSAIKLIKEADSFQEAYELAHRWANQNEFKITRIVDLTLDGLIAKPYLSVRD